MHEYASILFWLIVGHCVCDYPLQGDFLAKAKNPYAPIPGVPWRIALVAHSLIHAGAVMLVTSSLFLAVIEWTLHAYIDREKCNGTFGFAADQWLHVGCKVGITIGMWACGWHLWGIHA